MIARNAGLALALALAACTVRPTPADTDGTGTGTGTDSDSASASATADTLTGAATTGGGLHSGPCKPKNGDDDCFEGLVCCSDDPATVGGKIPNYYMDGVNNADYGSPIFSDNNNALSSWGYCIETGGFTSPLINGCPVPCNPTWAPVRIAEICGSAVCCPFTAVDPDKDCIIDPDSGRWRSVNGLDVIAERTPWGATHATNQDPFAEGCQLFSAGNQAVLLDCIEQLTVADQRGFCVSVACPCTEDLCDMKNPDYVPRCN